MRHSNVANFDEFKWQFSVEALGLQRQKHETRLNLEFSDREVANEELEARGNVYDRLSKECTRIERGARIARAIPASCLTYELAAIKPTFPA